MNNISSYFVLFILTHFEKLTITKLYSKNLYSSFVFQI